MPHSGSLTLLAIGASAIAYLAVVRLSRWRAYNNVHNRFAHKIGSLTVAEAQEIMHLSSSWDMPLIVVYGLSFAILRTYGVPSISRILVKTGELKNAGTVAKRFLDTSIIVASWTGYPMDLSAPLTSIVAAEREREDPTTREEQDPRAFVAISRMNWLHARYPILNRDYLITLSFFITEPARWAKEYGWREFSPLEKEAFFVFYKHLGEMMKIEGIPDTLEDMMGWVEAFEQEHMVPAEVNNQMAHGMLRELTEGVPSFAKPLVGNLFICLFDERLRTAMMLPEQPPWAHALLRGTLRAFAFISRHLLLPRAKPFVIVPIARPKPQAGGSLPRMRPNWDVSMPWYKPKPSALGMLLEYVKVALGLRTWDALPGPKYKQDGYRLEELGPLKFENDGHDDVMRRAAELMGCPVSGMWSRPPTSTKKEIVSTANGAHSESTL